jgi:hypothetical protein
MLLGHTKRDALIQIAESQSIHSRCSVHVLCCGDRERLDTYQPIIFPSQSVSFKYFLSKGIANIGIMAVMTINIGHITS